MTFDPIFHYYGKHGFITAKYPFRRVVQTFPQQGGELPRRHLTDIERLEQIFHYPIRKVDKPIDPKK